MRWIYEAAAVVALAAPASGAPSSSLGLVPGFDSPSDATLGTPFQISHLGWELDPADPAGPVFPELDGPFAPITAVPQPTMIPTPGTAALTVLAGLVVVLPRKRG